MKTGAALSLRTKLVLASVLVEVVMLGLLVINNLRLNQESLIEQTRLRIEELAILFNASLAPALAELDYGSLYDTLRQIRHEQAITYLVLYDRERKPVVRVGWPDDLTVPAPARTLRMGEVQQDHFDLVVPIRLADQDYGLLHYGLSTQFLHAAHERLLRQSLFIAGAEVVLSIMLLTTMGL